MPQSELSYGSINIHHREGATSGDNDNTHRPLLVGVEGDDSVSNSNSNAHSTKRKCLPYSLRWIGLSALMILVTMLVLVNHHNSHNHHHVPHNRTSTPSSSATSTSTSTSTSVDDDDGDDDISDNEEDHSAAFPSPTDLGLHSIQRQQDASPSEIWGNRTGQPLPTNSWYLNLLSHRAAGQPDESTRVYTVPYILDTAAANDLAGIRLHWPVVSANDRNVQMVDDWKNGVTLGMKPQSLSGNQKYTVVSSEDEQRDDELSHLGVSLQWDHGRMKTHIVRGMPFATNVYYDGALPELYSYNGPATDVFVVDGVEQPLECAVGSTSSSSSTTTSTTTAGTIVSVEKEVQLHFINSDFTWGVFFSRPVQIRCTVSDEKDEKIRDFSLSVVSYQGSDDNDDNSNDNDNNEPLTVRMALLNQCTTGKSNIKAHCDTKPRDIDDYVQALRDTAHLVPSLPKLDFDYSKSSSSDARITIDWNVETTDNSNKDKDQLLMFALPHHQESFASTVEVTPQCAHTFHGKTCLTRGSTWTLHEDLAHVSFTAPRPPEPDAIPALAQALQEDIHYHLSSNMIRGAADTYFSGKILARLARVIVIADELQKLASGSNLQYEDVDENLLLSMQAAASEELPSSKDITIAVDRLKEGVQIWLTPDKTEAPYVYDTSWGGMVNCGCRYVGEGDRGVCENVFPDCPALVDVNEDFGNGYYNDHHYHYGYHIYAAAVVAKFDPEWGAEFFDHVSLYIRDMANPFLDDEYFCQFRQKDWYLGSSWASGIVSAENSPHGRNEESSSEAIAAYEAVALYGTVMTDVFSSDSQQRKTAKKLRDAGRLLTASELRATNRYWHVWSSPDHERTYPAGYKQPVVGMLYETMASFQTWFAPYAVVSYGIQLMPFTPIAETRDDPAWAAELYPLYKQSCEQAGDFCADNGWTILQAGLCATSGNRAEALEQALAVPKKVFATEGGVGNSLTNTLWYIATRKDYDGSSSGN